MKKIFLGQLIVIFNVAFCPLAGYSQNLLNIDDFGKLLHDAWIEKKELSKSISNHKIDKFKK